MHFVSKKSSFILYDFSHLLRRRNNSSFDMVAMNCYHLQNHVINMKQQVNLYCVCCMICSRNCGNVLNGCLQDRTWACHSVVVPIYKLIVECDHLVLSIIPLCMLNSCAVNGMTIIKISKFWRNFDSPTTGQWHHKCCCFPKTPWKDSSSCSV